MKRGEWHEGGFLVLACSGLVGRDAGGVNPTISAGLMSLEGFPRGAAGCLYTWFDRVVVYFAEEKKKKTDEQMDDGSCVLVRSYY